MRCQGWAEVPLNERGREQARELGRRLRGRGIELIVSSHLSRARKTAELAREELAAARDAGEIELRVDRRLAETNRGEWETRIFADIMREDPQVWRAYKEHPESFTFPGGESFADQQVRVLEAVRDAAREGRVALLVTHGGSMRLVRAFLEGRGIEDLHAMKAPTGEMVEIDDPSIVGRIDALLEGGDDEPEEPAGDPLYPSGTG